MMIGKYTDDGKESLGKWDIVLELNLGVVA